MLGGREGHWIESQSACIISLLGPSWQLHFSLFPLPLITSHRRPAMLRAKSNNTFNHIGWLCQKFTCYIARKEITELRKRKRKKTGLKHSNTCAVLDGKNVNFYIFPGLHYWRRMWNIHEFSNGLTEMWIYWRPNKKKKSSDGRCLFAFVSPLQNLITPLSVYRTLWSCNQQYWNEWPNSESGQTQKPQTPLHSQTK